MSGKPMLIFDLDGTLWDSAANVAVSWNIVFRREYPSLPDLTKEDIHSVMGLTMKEIEGKLHPSMPEERHSELTDSLLGASLPMKQSDQASLFSSLVVSILGEPTPKNICPR